MISVEIISDMMLIIHNQNGLKVNLVQFVFFGEHTEKVKKCIVSWRLF